MRTSRLVVLLVIGLLGEAAAALPASDPVAVYARVDRVVLAPDTVAPKTIQVFGVFSVATSDDRNTYEPPARGYLYFTLAGEAALARREWADLKAIAGKRQIVALGNRYTTKLRVRAETDPPADPDPYMTDAGLTKITGRTDYEPIRALLDSRD
jgi:hypothetical protein